jgi:hypothetical protein
MTRVARHLLVAAVFSLCGGRAAWAGQGWTALVHASAEGERHAVRGVVRAVTDSSLTIARASHRAELLVFRLNADTVRSGTIEVGAVVSIRYEVDGDDRVATAVSGPRPKAGQRHD